MTKLEIVAIDATSDLMPAAYAVRHQVFVAEQAVPPALERDEFDNIAIHLIARRSDHVVGTLRIVVSGANARIGRMAVLAPARKGGVGTRLMQRAHEIAHAMNVREITLHAQLTAKDFYARLGYREAGGVFEEAGIAHVGMRRAVG